MTILKKFFLGLLFSLGITTTHAAIETIVFTGKDNATLKISRQENLAAFNACMQMGFVQNLAEEYVDKTDNGTIPVPICYNQATFNQKALSMLRTDIIDQLANLNGQDDSATLKTGFAGHTNQKLITLFNIANFLNIPIFLQALQEFLCENPDKLDTVFNDLLPDHQEEIVRLFIPNYTQNLAQLTHEPLKSRILDRVELHAYKHCHEQDINTWMDIVQRKAVLLGKAMAGVQRRAQEILGINNHNLHNNKTAVQQQFNNLPENILKMMLRFMSENTLQENVNITPIWDTVQRMHDQALNAKNILKKTPHLLWGFLKSLVGKKPLRKQVWSTLGRILDLSNTRDTFSDQNFNNILLIIDTLYGNSIKKLDLNHNQLTQVPDFSNLKNLQTLKLGDNQLTQIPDFSNLKNLLTLDLGDNQLTQIPNFSNLKNLQTLKLGDNQLTQIPNFSNLKNLQTLELWNNPIVTRPAWQQRRQTLIILHPGLILYN
ncbi:MAG: leucine-rich repeat domain-containing protein [bacterium]